MLQRQVAADAWFHAADPQYGQIGFQGVPVTGGRNSAQYRTLIGPFAHTLRNPKQKGQFVQRERLRREAAAALTVGNGRGQVHCPNTLPLLDWRQIEPSGVGRNGFFQERWWNIPALVGL